MKRTALNIFSLLFLLVQTSVCLAAESDEELEELVEGTKSDMLIVIGGGLAGAILGLSTLSFVDEPKEHTKNITVGASLGIIAGVGYVAMSQATKSRDMMYEEEGGQGSLEKLSGKNFGTYARNSWHDQNVLETYKPVISPYSLGFATRF